MQHRVRKSVETIGWVASCSCSWRTARRTREQRDIDVDVHELLHMADRTAAAIGWHDDE